MSIEVELKLKIRDKAEITASLKQLGFTEEELVVETDTYYTAAHHDFAALDEALRIRTVENLHTKEQSAVITYNESLRVGLRKTGIKVQTISPGFVRTPLTSANPYKMPFVLTPDEFAERAVKTIDSDASYRTIPWQMGLLAKAMRIAPNCLWDKIVANRKQKPRLADKQKAEAEAAQRK